VAVEVVVAEPVVVGVGSVRDWGLVKDFVGSVRDSGLVKDFGVGPARD